MKRPVFGWIRQWSSGAGFHTTMISNGVNWTFSQPSSPFGEAKIWWLFEDTLLGASKTNHQENSHRCPILRQSQHLRSCSTSKLCAATGQMRKALCHIQTIGSRAKSFMSILVAVIPRESSLTKSSWDTLVSQRVLSPMLGGNSKGTHFYEPS